MHFDCRVQMILILKVIFLIWDTLRETRSKFLFLTVSGTKNYKKSKEFLKCFDIIHQTQSQQKHIFLCRPWKTRWRHIWHRRNLWSGQQSKILPRTQKWHVWRHLVFWGLLLKFSPWYHVVWRHLVVLASRKNDFSISIYFSLFLEFVVHNENFLDKKLSSSETMSFSYFFLKISDFG